MQEFEYCQVTTNICKLEVPEVGECAIEGKTDSGSLYYLITRTDSGFTEIMQCGPFDPLTSIPPDRCSYSFERIVYNEKKLGGIISSFLMRNRIVSAELCTRESACENCDDLLEYMGE